MHADLARPADALPGLKEFMRNFGPILRAPLMSNEGHPVDRLQLLEAYTSGLLLPSGRKTMDPMAEQIGEAEHRIQHFVTYSPWDHEAMQAKIREVMRPYTTHDGLFVFDDSSILKRGEHSVGVGRQYLGCVGKVANGQVGTCMTYCQPSQRRNADAIHFPMATRLYLPKDWTDDPAKREKAQVPESVEFQEKWRIALSQLDLALAEKIPHAGSVFDAGYGDVPAFRAALRERNEAYIGGVTTTRLRVLVKGSAPGLGKRFRERPSTPKQIARALSSKAWRKIRWTPGDQTSRSARFARVRVRVVQDGQPTDEDAWLLLEQRPKELKAYLCWRFEGSLRFLVLTAHQRWTVEKEFEEQKQEVGWDHFEGRTWRGLHHHWTMCMVTFAFLAKLRADTPVPPGASGFESLRG